MKIKYPTKVGRTLYPAGTVVELLTATDILVKKDYPDIQYKEGSRQVAVKFPDREHMTILDISQVED